MSVNLLQRPLQRASVTDELESFFHVLLYYSIRHLRSNCDDPTSWIEDYFNTYAGHEHMCACGQRSTTLEVTGRLRTLPPERPLLFGSPLDALFSEMLLRFRARYKVLNYELSQSARRSRPAPAYPPKTPPAPTRQPAPLRSPRILNEKQAKMQAEIAAKLAKFTPPDLSPSPEERRLASEVADHKFVLALFEKTLGDAHWPEDDRIPITNGPPVVAGATPPTQSNPAQRAPSRKRQKTTPPTRNAPPPARLHASTRRTRSQTRTALQRSKS